MRIRVWVSAAVAVVVCMCGIATANAQSTGNVTGSLVTLVNSGQYQFNRLERLSAIGNQTTYNQLVGTCGNLLAASAACPAEMFRVFQISQELVQSANELLGAGPTQFSLRVDDQGLGFALRWTAAEELSAPGSASTEFANTQIASVMSRITAIRFGGGDAQAQVTARGARGGSAGDDSVSMPASRWGVFLDGGFGYGRRHPTELEDAFAFDDRSFTLGVDYRVTPRLVLGAMLGSNNQRIDFDSSQSVVSGNLRASGAGLTLYGLYEWEGPYLDMALGYQRLAIDSRREINYPSFNINVESVNALATGTTHSANTIGTISFGWPLNMRAVSVDPYLNMEYRDITINGFRENSIYTGGTRNGMPSGYGFAFGDQHLSSMDVAIGIKLQYTWTPHVGVFIPYIKGELHHNFDTDPFTVDATYNDQYAGGTPFELPSDKRVSTYRIYAAGISAVLPHGWQMFAQYQATSGISYLEHHVISAGIRGEF